MVIRIARQFGQCIRARREELGWTQEELAVRAGVSRSTVYRLEAGTTTSLYPAKLLSMLDALGLEVSVGLKNGVGAVPEGVGSFDGENAHEPDSTVVDVVVEESIEQPQFTLKDLLAMGDAYKDYAELLKRRENSAILDDREV